MGKFYLPEIIRINRIPIIVYPAEGIEKLIKKDLDSIQKHLNQLYERNNLPKGTFNIDILWADSGELMTDIWAFSHLKSWGSGALSSEQTYRLYTPDNTCGTSAEFGHSVLGREAEHRFGKSLKDYLQCRPELHPLTTNNKRFIS